LTDYVLILANSGMRVGEANNLKIRDLELFEDDLGRRNYRFKVKGKTGERDVILRASSLPPIKLWLLVAYIVDGDNYSLTDAEMEALWHRASHKLLPEIEAEIGRLIRERAKPKRDS
jgi:integrase